MSGSPATIISHFTSLSLSLSSVKGSCWGWIMVITNIYWVLTMCQVLVSCELPHLSLTHTPGGRSVINVIFLLREKLSHRAVTWFTRSPLASKQQSQDSASLCSTILVSGWSTVAVMPNASGFEKYHQQLTLLSTYGSIHFIHSVSFNPISKCEVDVIILIL